MKKIVRRIVKIIAGIVVALLLIHAVLLVISGIALRRAQDALRAAGRPMTGAEIIPPEVPADENAAPLYESAFALLKSEGDGEKTLIHRMGRVATEYWDATGPDEELPEFESLLENATVVQALALVEQANARPKCNFDLPYDQGMAMLVPHVHPMLNVNRFLCSKALLEARRGHGDQAWKTIEQALLMADALRDEPVLISALVRAANQMRTLAAWRRVYDLAPPTAEYTARLSALITATGDAEPFVRAMDGERIFGGEWIFRHFRTYETDVFMGQTSDLSGIAHVLAWMSIRALSYPPFLQQNHACYLRFMGNVSRDFQTPYWELPYAGSDSDISFPWYSSITQMILPSLYSTRKRFTVLQAEASITLTGVALKRHKEAHGSYPSALSGIEPTFLPEAPLDPFTGAELVYRTEGNGFVLYSLGENRQDDGGQAETKDNRGSEAFDIVWRSIE